MCRCKSIPTGLAGRGEDSPHLALSNHWPALVWKVAVIPTWRSPCSAEIPRSTVIKTLEIEGWVDPWVQSVKYYPRRQVEYLGTPDVETGQQMEPHQKENVVILTPWPLNSNSTAGGRKLRSRRKNGVFRPRMCLRRSFRFFVS